MEFITGLHSPTIEKKVKRLSLCYGKPSMSTPDTDPVIHNVHSQANKIIDKTEIMNDGLYVPAEGPLTTNIVKPYKILRNYEAMKMKSNTHPLKKLLDIAVREVTIHGPTVIEIISVAILYKKNVICKMLSPFNRKLYKLLITDSPDCANNFFIKVTSRNGSSSLLPLFIPSNCVNGKKCEIDFSISENGIVHSGTLLCTISISIKNSDEKPKVTNNLYKLTNDPNDPQNSLSLMNVTNHIKKHPVKYFLLYDLELTLSNEEDTVNKPLKVEKFKSPTVVVLEQPTFTFKDLSFGTLFEVKRPLRPSSGSNIQKLQQEITGRDEILSITILRGVQLPVREDTGMIHPLVIVKWGEISHATKAVDGVTPVWNQTLHFSMPKANRDNIKLSLFDQHPTWGYQWLGETTIPVEFYDNYQEFEKWVNLTPVTSPIVRFGYKNNADITHTRIYIVMKLKKNFTSENIDEKNITTDILAKTIQRCLVTPYKLNGVNDPNDVGLLVMLLNPLSTRYGPLNPRQALKLNKVDYYGRAALLATLLHGLGDDLQVYIVLGTSQARKWAVFVLTIEKSRTVKIWDPENGEHYNLSDARCSLIRISRIINHQQIWKNLQSTTIPSNLKFNLKSSKDWQSIGMNGTTVSAREAHILELQIQERIEEGLRAEIETEFRDKLSQCRSKMGFITIFNPYADGVLRKLLAQLSNREEVQIDNSDFNQIYRVYHMYGFILNLRFATTNQLIDFFMSTKIHETTGPVEFALVCDIQKYVAKISSFWLAVAVLKNRE